MKKLTLISLSLALILTTVSQSRLFASEITPTEIEVSAEEFGASDSVLAVITGSAKPAIVGSCAGGNTHGFVINGYVPGNPSRAVQMFVYPYAGGLQACNILTNWVAAGYGIKINGNGTKTVYPTYDFYAFQSVTLYSKI